MIKIVTDSKNNFVLKNKTSEQKKIVLDATNLFDGGGLSHLREFTKSFKVINFLNLELLVIGNKKALSVTADASNIKKIHHPVLDKNILFRTFFRIFLLTRKVSDIDMIFDPGGGYFSRSVPYVTMSRNMLVFEKRESQRYGFSLKRFRLWILNKLQTKSMNGAKGTLFISNYAKNYILNLPDIYISKYKVVHHGATELFLQSPKKQLDIDLYSIHNPFKLLYVSIIDVYKHHEELVDAVVELRNKYPVEVTFVGGAYAPSLKVLEHKLNTILDSDSYIHYVGKKSLEELKSIYHSKDLFIFPSSCENMPNILIEAMSAGLPIACSEKGPMPEFLKDAGVYFDPESVNSITEAIEKMILDKDLRSACAQKAYTYAEEYSWKKCTEETIDFLVDCINDKSR